METSKNFHLERLGKLQNAKKSIPAQGLTLGDQVQAMQWGHMYEDALAAALFLMSKASGPEGADEEHDSTMAALGHRMDALLLFIEGDSSAAEKAQEKWESSWSNLSAQAKGFVRKVCPDIAA